MDKQINIYIYNNILEDKAYEVIIFKNATFPFQVVF